MGDDAYANVSSLQAALRAIPLPPLPPAGGGRKLSLELNYRSQQGILDMAQRLLAPAYLTDPAAQLRLVTPSVASAEAEASAAAAAVAPREAAAGAAGAAGAAAAAAAAVARAVECVHVVEVEDGEHEAEFIVDAILRLRDEAAAAQVRSRDACMHASRSRELTTSLGSVTRLPPRLRPAPPAAVVLAAAAAAAIVPVVAAAARGARGARRRVCRASPYSTAPTRRRGHVTPACACMRAAHLGVGQLGRGEPQLGL